MLKFSLLLSLLSLASASGGELITRLSDADAHPCERLTTNQTWAQNPRGCDLWFYCEEFPDRIGVGRCPEGYHYDEPNQACNTIEEVGCDIDDNLWGATCDGNSAKKVAHPYSCSEYTVCIEDLQADFECPEGLHFSPYDQDCVNPSVANCRVDRRTCDGAISYIPLHIPSSRSCSVYYLCFNNFLQRLECGPGQHWDRDNRWCAPESDANCDTSGVLPDLPDIPSQLSIDCTQFANGTRVPHGESCKFWFWCINDRSQLFWCGEGALFDVDTRTCTVEDRATCFTNEQEVLKDRKPDPNTPVPTKEIEEIYDFPSPPIMMKKIRN